MCNTDDVYQTRNRSNRVRLVLDPRICCLSSMLKRPRKKNRISTHTHTETLRQEKTKQNMDLPQIHPFHGSSEQNSRPQITLYFGFMLTKKTTTCQQSNHAQYELLDGYNRRIQPNTLDVLGISCAQASKQTYQISADRARASRELPCSISPHRLKSGYSGLTVRRIHKFRFWGKWTR